MPKPERIASRHAFYVLEIATWQWSYRFGVNTVPRDLDIPYSENRSVEIKGTMVHPKPHTLEPVEVRLMPSLDLDPATWRGKPPRGVGHIERRRKAFTVVLSFPVDVLPPLLTAFAHGHFRYLVIEAVPMFRGNADVRSWHLAATFGPDDLA